MNYKIERNTMYSKTEGEKIEWFIETLQQMDKEIEKLESVRYDNPIDEQFRRSDLRGLKNRKHGYEIALIQCGYQTGLE
ncbi:hypothetical protein BKP45_05035 [Anaerobacillus alkalidiazotrophicus]|uniref:Uncharacterized protein n=1 Tax=Anaerobacillus alkalidiazotrophicus TaxID=472963 RepID=A0A1S2MC72_9BACI|nr:hypothetical protein [Anaerobacillus alkalidiazotrophicus]OIJ22043.1 hypothetical protein BKP45_05035 [Anaerobacillus alkalidiazotrophicus]